MKELKLEFVKMVQENNKRIHRTLYRNIKFFRFAVIIILCFVVCMIGFLFSQSRLHNRTNNSYNVGNNIELTECDVSTYVSRPKITIGKKVEEVDDCYDLHYLAKCVMAEAGNQDDYGKRLVIDVILNRAEKYNCTTTEIINQKNQFEVVSNGSINNQPVLDNILELIWEEQDNRTDKEVLYFRTDYYHSFGTPLYQYQDHYFSKD